MEQPSYADVKRLANDVFDRHRHEAMSVMSLRGMIEDAVHTGMLYQINKE